MENERERGKGEREGIRKRTIVRVAVEGRRVAVVVVVKGMWVVLWEYGDVAVDVGEEEGEGEGDDAKAAKGDDDDDDGDGDESTAEEEGGGGERVDGTETAVVSCFRKGWRRRSNSRCPLTESPLLVTLAVSSTALGAEDAAVVAGTPLEAVSLAVGMLRDTPTELQTCSAKARVTMEKRGKC